MSNFLRGTIFPSVLVQTPQPYFTLDDPYPQYIQVQRTPASISGNTVSFHVNAFDPNAFMRSKAYIKIVTSIEKRELELDNAVPPVVVADVASNYDIKDRIYKKPGLVLQNSCTDVSLRLNSHTMHYKDLRYITSKLNTSFAGKNIVNNYLSTSGGQYEELNGVYNEFGCINSRRELPFGGDNDIYTFQEIGFDLGPPANQLEFTQATNVLEFTANGGAAIALLVLQEFVEGDIINLVSGELLRVNFTIDNDNLNVTRLDAVGDITPAQDLVAGDLVIRKTICGFNGDDGRETSYAEAFRDVNLGQTTSTFNFTESLSFGPFNHLADYDRGEIYKNAWNIKQSPLIPYVRELELSMTFKDLAANSLVYSYGKLNTIKAAGVNTRVATLTSISIDSAELVLIWVKPRDELLINMPNRVRIQSWMYDHKQFDLGLVNNGTSVASNENNIYTQQVPSYLLYYAMIDKDSLGYSCTAVNNDFNELQQSSTISIDENSVESHMFPLSVVDSNGFETGADFTLRSNTLGGDDILDVKYNQKELYRLTLKNSMSNFPWGETKFRGLSVVNNLQATYPSQFYIFLGEQELNSFFIRKGQLQTSNVMNYNSTLVALDGYSISKNIQNGAFTGGDKNYALHIFYVYDRFYIELDNDGFTDSKFDSSFF